MRIRRWFCFALWLALVGLPMHAAGGTIEQAQQLLRSVSQTRERDRRFALSDQAQALCEQATRERPGDAVPHIVLAQALSVADLQHPEACRPHACERAIAELKQARVLDKNGVEAQRIASDLGLILSRVGSYDEALKEYDRALRLVDPDRSPSVFEDFGHSVLYGNSAETLMAIGKLDRAIERYRQAEAVSTPGGIEWELAEWGLGVALDRDGQAEKARQAIQRALDFDPTMAHLADDSVFFEPVGDKRYYEALGHELAGDQALALASWRAFVTESPSSRYVARAKAHIAALKRAPADRSIEPDRVHLMIGDIVDLHGTRSSAELRDVVQRHEDELRLCYARTLRADAAARGEMRVQLVVDPSGYLSARAHVQESTVNESTLSHCVELTASTWRFSMTDTIEPDDVILTLVFGNP